MWHFVERGEMIETIRDFYGTPGLNPGITSPDDMTDEQKVIFFLYFLPNDLILSSVEYTNTKATKHFEEKRRSK